jgi:hypothetical protein
MQLMVKGVKGGSFGLIQNRWQSCTRTRSNIGVALTKEIDGETEEQFAMLLRPRSLLDVTSGKQVLRLKTPLRDQNGRVVVDFVIQGRTARGEISFER